MSDSNIFVKGQRYISQTESELGLGVVSEQNPRMVKIQFDAVDESRIYAKDNSPISRVEFEIKDTVTLQSGKTAIVQNKQVVKGLIAYLCQFDDGKEEIVLETRLANQIKLNQPIQRLLTGQVESLKWYEAKLKSFQIFRKLQQNQLFGFLGCRTSLLKHQLYIANTVGQRYAPRVLLADEVGLGKTIEAGLIIHQQLLTNRSQRILIIVPESLKHQWMVEMLRRFNLSFTVYDEEQCQAIEESTTLDTPFESSPLGLVSLDFIKEKPARFQQLLETQWDMLVVDEAHHLQWSEEAVSEEYQMIEELTNSINGVLLLTATPEQLGKESHFARLRLLDSNRFYDFSKFQEEEKQYEELADLIQDLNESENISDSLKLKLENNFGKTITTSEPSLELKQEWINELLDQHGTGRLLFRNTRSAIKGFPMRKLNAYQLENSYPNLKDEEVHLYPDRSMPLEKGIAMDSRFIWLTKIIKELSQKKILLIAKHKETVLEIEEALRTKHGIHAAVFHEGLSLIERDRSAAWFADFEDGAQILLCSEIGSEGRNFQFSHHAIFFDLPLNPDLLEQRIGRLDRIGQLHDINIHVPYFENSAQQKLFEFHHDGLGAFEDICPAAFAVFNKNKSQLILHLSSQNKDSYDDFIDQIKSEIKIENEKFDKGRDRILEFNSCREPQAEELLDLAYDNEQKTCREYLHKIFDLFGVEHEEIRNKVELIKAGESMQDYFPNLIEEGMSITFDRDMALANENLHFIHWEHPMVQGALEMTMSHEKGNASVSVLHNSGLTPSSLLLEFNFNFNAIAKKELQIYRYLSEQTKRLILDEKGNDVSVAMSDKIKSGKTSRVEKQVALQVIKMKKSVIKSMSERVDSWSEPAAKNHIFQAINAVTSKLDLELSRMHQLKEKNPSVRDEEIIALEDQKSELIKAINDGQMQLISLRLLICV